jgi:hypothetical protein
LPLSLLPCCCRYALRRRFLDCTSNYYYYYFYFRWMVGTIVWPNMYLLSPLSGRNCWKRSRRAGRDGVRSPEWRLCVRWNGNDFTSTNLFPPKIDSSESTKRQSLSVCLCLSVCPSHSTHPSNAWRSMQVKKTYCACPNCSTVLYEKERYEYMTRTMW